METLLFVNPRPARRPWHPWSGFIGLDEPAWNLVPLCRMAPLKRRPSSCQCHQGVKKSRCEAREKTTEENSFRVAVDAAGFRPEEIHVQESNGVVTVQARQQEHCQGGTVNKRMFRRVQLPFNVQKNGLTSRLSRSGQLILEAPLQVQPSLEEAKKNQQVPSKYAAPAADKVEEASGNQPEAETLAKEPVPDKTEEHVEQNAKHVRNEGTTPTVHVVDLEEEHVPECGAHAATNGESRSTETEQDQATQVKDDAAVTKTGDDQETGTAANPDPEKDDDSSQDQEIAVQVTRSEAATDVFRVSADVRDFLPQDVSVKVADGVVTVQAVHEESSPEGSSTRSLLRRFTLPERVDPDQVTSRLTRRGQLIVEAPVGGERAVVNTAAVL